jgi:ABC-2 type transport system ATP-binding protein
MNISYSTNHSDTRASQSPIQLVSDSRVEMISVHDLVVTFGEFRAVDGIDISVGRGEVFGFLGPNGAGKSTTIRVLIGCQRPTAGKVHVAGCQLPQELKCVKSLFGYVPDSDNHIDEFTGRENLELFASLYQLPDHSVVERLLSRLELIDAADVAVGNYSKGMRRKLLIVRELLHRPQVLFLDEPTANLDPHSTSLVRDLLSELAADGMTVFLTTHNMDEVEEICDRAAIICRGKIVACDTPANFIARYSESKVTVQYSANDETHRQHFNLECQQDREQLAEIVRQSQNVRLSSDEFHFEDVFLKITGQAYT